MPTPSPSPPHLLLPSFLAFLFFFVVVVVVVAGVVVVVVVFPPRLPSSSPPVRADVVNDDVADVGGDAVFFVAG
jgi:hypothetical protein